jgi:hypothetical protein
MTQEALAQLDRPLLDAGGLDLDAAAKVTYVLRQRFRYDYDGPAYDLDHRLVVVPRARHGSLRRRLHTVEVSVPDARIRNRRDGYGNVVVQVGIDVVPATVEFALTAVVERTGPCVDAVLPLSAVTDQRLLPGVRRAVLHPGPGGDHVRVRRHLLRDHSSRGARARPRGVPGPRPSGAGHLPGRGHPGALHLRTPAR